MVSTASGIFTFCNEVQSKNILSPSVVSVSGRVMFESAVQPLNTSAPSEVTPSQKSLCQRGWFISVKGRFTVVHYIALRSRTGRYLSVRMSLISVRSFP